MPSLLHLTPIHFRVYDFIVNYKIDHDGISPTVAEITQGCRLSSTSAVSHYLNSLVLFGMIKCDYGKGKSRMIAVLGARWIPPSGSMYASPVSQGEHVISVSGSSITE